MSEIKNKPDSILARLKNIARENAVEFNSILILYMQERFLYRLSISAHADNFLLKGGLLLFSYDKFNTRPTIDMDFLALKIENDHDILLKALSAIARIQCDDGLVFRTEDITVETILEHGLYRGLKAAITCNLGKARNRLQIDIAFGDVVVPKPIDIAFPVLLETDPVPIIKAYSLESAIAEKFEAMVKLSLLNSRMKDFYDIYTLSKSKDFESIVLREAISQTFKRRKTPIERDQTIFQNLFIKSAEKQREWSNYLIRIRAVELESFEDVMRQIIIFLKPIYCSICDREDFPFNWSSGKNEWVKK
jgi:predicted nucleotidyltransferase component of viral defense system